MVKNSDLSDACNHGHALYYRGVTPTTRSRSRRHSCHQERFKWNMGKVYNGERVVAMKGDSLRSLAELVARGLSSSFDAIYVDASHQASGRSYAVYCTSSTNLSPVPCPLPPVSCPLTPAHYSLPSNPCSLTPVLGLLSPAPCPLPPPPCPRPLTPGSRSPTPVTYPLDLVVGYVAPLPTGLLFAIVLFQLSFFSTTV